MADRYLLEESSVDGYLLEDGSGVLVLEAAAAAEVALLPIYPTFLTGIGSNNRFPGNRVE